METVIKQINTEKPSEHWEFVDCKDKVTVDLGCGRWEHVEYRDPSWPTTPEWLLQKGASVVHAYDIDSGEVNWYNTTFASNNQIKAYQKSITSAQDIRDILHAHHPKAIKCDIETYESALLDLTDEEFCSVDFYAIELHTEDLYNRFVEKFKQLNYTIVAIVVLVHASSMKVLFAKKNE